MLNMLSRFNILSHNAQYDPALVAHRSDSSTWTIELGQLYDPCRLALPLAAQDWIILGAVTEYTEPIEHVEHIELLVTEHIEDIEHTERIEHIERATGD